MPAPRSLLIGSSLLLAAGGAGGAAIWQLMQARAQTEAKLAQAEAAFQQQRAILQTLESEHESLADRYDAMKGRWESSDKEVARLTRTASETEHELATLAKDRETLSRAVEQAKTARQEAEAQIGALKKDVHANRLEQTRLETRLRDTEALAAKAGDTEQLTGELIAQREEAKRLSDELATLSRAYERLAEAHQDALDARDAGLEVRSPSAVLPPGPPMPQALREEHPEQDRFRENPRLASLYRRLATSYFSTYRYTEAARLYEQSLAYENDPDAHTQLALLYSRFLHNPERAAWHTARAGSRDPVRAGLAPIAAQRGLPRNDWRQLWRWLTD